MNNILIVEDEHLIARLIEMTLPRAGYRCTLAEDGRTAADLIETTNFDMALLDIMLPGLDGYALLECLRPQGVPVIFITAKSAVKDRVQGLRLGADDYITKPFAAEELVARMETVLRRTGRGGRELCAYDVVLDNFGPNESLGSVHIEVPDDMCARDIHALTRQISEGLTAKLGILTTVGIYAANTTGAFAPLHADLDALAKSDPAILQVHGFYVDEKTSTVYFDLVIGFKADDDAIRDKIIAHLKEKYPDYTYNVVIDHDYEDDQPT